MSPLRPGRSVRSLVLLAAVASASASASAESIVVLRVGDGLSALSASATPVFLEKRSATDGSLLQSWAVAVAASGSTQPLTLSGTATTEGHLSRSLDRRFLAFAGYGAVPGTLNVSSSSPSTVNRVIGRLDALGGIDTTTRLSTPAGNARSAATADGTFFWMASSGSGVHAAVLGSAGTSTQISTAPANTRVVGVAPVRGPAPAAQLYVSAASSGFVGVATVGSGLPTTGGQTTTLLPGFPTTSGPSPGGYVVFDLSPSIAGPDVVYVADDRSLASGGGLQKWTFDGASWTLAATFSNGLTAGLRGLAGTLDDAGHPVLYATTADTPTKLVRATDDGSPSPAFGLLATAPANTAFRGVAMAPGNDLIFADGFESNDLSAWSAASTAGGTLVPDAAAAMGGSPIGLAGTITDTVSRFVEDDTPNDEGRYRARFWFDPRDFDPGMAEAHFRVRIFLGLEENPVRRLVAIVLKRQGAQYSVMGRARLDDNSQADTGFFPISDQPHAIEIDWQRASAPGVPDGSLRLWIDGVPTASLAGLQDAASAVDFARLGALSLKTGVAGSLSWDEFASRRETYIGP